MIGSEKLQTQLEKWAKIEDKMAIVEVDTEKKITYKDFFLAVNALRSYFFSSKTILVAIPGGISDSIIWVAALTSGSLLIPVSPYLTGAEYEQIEKQYKPDLIITEKSLREIEGIAFKENTKSSRPKEGSVLFFTSGSTGIPKGVVLSATQVVITASNIQRSHKLTQEDIGFTSLPFYHVNAPVVSLVSTLLSGGTLVIAPKYSTSRFWGWIEEYKPTWISMVPTIVAMLLSTEKPKFLKSSPLRFIRTASEPLPPENLKKFEEKFNIPLIETYGLSEAASTIVANPVPPGKHKAGAVGFPLGVTIKIVKPETGKALPAGEIGEVWVKGPNVIKNYLHNHSAKSFSKGFFKTGDLGYLDTEGYLHLTGRIKDIIIRGGENIAPREIEDVLLSYPGVREAIVVGQPDPIYGEQVIAFVVLEPKGKDDSSEKIITFAAKKLTQQKVPFKVYLVEDLPRNKTGKVDKITLRTQGLRSISSSDMRT